MSPTDVEASSPTKGRYSYSSQKMGLTARANELLQLIKMTRSGPSGSVAFTLNTMRTTADRVRDLTGVTLENLKILDIGPGQQLRHLRCLAMKNDAVGIDLDIIPQGFHLLDYLRMLRYSPLMRTAKTLARKALRRDAQFAAALAKELGIEKVKPVKVLRMSATQMTFPDDTFGFVCSYSVFEHIDDPAAALREVKRVLRPGGVAYISVHIYTSHSGAHDPNIMAKGKPAEPLWPHLRPAWEQTVAPSTFLNRFSLEQWRTLFSEVMPGVHLVHERQDDEIGDGLTKLRAQGELGQYSDEELMTVNYVGVWKKP